MRLFLSAGELPRGTLLLMRGSELSNPAASQAGLIVWAYFATVSADPGRVPAGWHPFSDDQVMAMKMHASSVLQCAHGAICRFIRVP